MTNSFSDRTVMVKIQMKMILVMIMTIVEIKEEDQLKNLLLIYQTQWQKKLLKR